MELGFTGCRAVGRRLALPATAQYGGDIPPGSTCTRGPAGRSADDDRQRAAAGPHVNPGVRWAALPLFVLACAPPPPDVGLNEIGTTWAELHNQTDAAASIGDWTVQLDLRTPWTIPGSTEVASLGFRVIEGLDVSEGTLIVRSADGEIVQEVDVPALDDGQSYARVPDGTGRWRLVDAPTRGTTNDPE